MASFNRALLVKNIKYLASKRGVNLGTLERTIGVSTGYFSRIINDEGKVGSTVLDVIYKVGDNLHIPVSSLLSIDLTGLTPNEELLSKFFTKVFQDTVDCSLVWECETEQYLQGCLKNGKHILIDSEISQNMMIFHYTSRFGQNISIAGNAYKVELEEQTLYLVKVSDKEGNLGYEMYFLDEYNRDYPVDPLYSAYQKNALFEQVNNLYTAATESSRHVKLSDSALASIHHYLEPQWPEDIPF